MAKSRTSKTRKSRSSTATRKTATRKTATRKTATRKTATRKTAAGRTAKVSAEAEPNPPAFADAAVDRDWSGFPASLVALARLPVSGRYAGAMTFPSAGEFELEMRVDVDQSHPQSPVLNRVSWDLTQVFSSTDSTWRVYRSSWIMDAPSVSFGEGHIGIRGTARTWSGGETLAATVQIPWTASQIGPAMITLTDGAEEHRFRCDWKSNLFRNVELQVDVCKSVNTAPLLPSYDTHSHNDRPADLTQRTVSIETAYAESGIGITIPDGHTVIDDSDAEFESWTAAELHEAMVSHFEKLADQPQWRLWGLMAGEYERPAVGGVMFDAATQYGGAGQGPERQGFAIFRNHSWFDNLVDGAPANQDQAWSARHFLYTWVHEAGHAFNHLHSWDKARPDALSWMNYDWKYDSRTASHNFWKEFRFQFDPDELLHLRHGTRNAVIMGGDPWSSGAHMESDGNELSGMATVDGVAPVEVLLRSPEMFQFMEPVSLEVRLRNLAKRAIRVDSNLAPEFGIATVLIKGPDGSVRQYEPLMCKLAERDMVSLQTANKSQTGTDRHSQSIDLTFGKNGFYFDHPGQYLIRVIFQGLDGTLIPSNLHRIRIAYPPGADAERLAQDYFTRDVGLAVYLNGSRSERLSGAMSTLQEIAQRFPTERLAVKVASILATAFGNSFFALKDQKMYKQAAADPKEALSLTDQALAVYSSSDSKAANLPHRELVEQRAGFWNAMGDARNAKAETTSLCSALSRRGVNSSVLKSIRTATGL